MSNKKNNTIPTGNLEYEKILESHKANSKLAVLVFFLGLFLGMLVTVIIVSQEHMLF